MTIINMNVPTHRQQQQKNRVHILFIQLFVDDGVCRPLFVVVVVVGQLHSRALIMRVVHNIVLFPIINSFSLMDSELSCFFIFLYFCCFFVLFTACSLCVYVLFFRLFLYYHSLSLYIWMFCYFSSRLSVLSVCDFAKMGTHTLCRTCGNGITGTRSEEC